MWIVMQGKESFTSIKEDFDEVRMELDIGGQITFS